MKSFLLTLFLLLHGPAVAMGQTPAENLRKLEEKVLDLEKRLAALAATTDPETRAQLEEIRRQIEVLTREIENLKSGAPEMGAAAGEHGSHGLGPAASKVYGVARGVSIGGYGEVLYQNFDSRRDDGAASGRIDQIDLLRAVLYFGYKFDSRFLFNSEIEYEHATTGEGAEEKGEISVEFATLEFLPRRELGMRAGLLLMPVGFVNELHEPPVFLGARRPEVEQRILPTTWRELGAGVFGEAGPVSYRAYLINGLDSAGFSAASPIREGRQSGSNASAEDFACVVRVDYVGLPGLLAGASAYSGASGQGRSSPAGDFDGRVSILEGHVEWRYRGIQLRGLLAGAKIGDATRINLANGLAGTESIGERFWGGYAEAGFDLLSARGGEASLIPFARYERFDTQSRVPRGFLSDPANQVSLWTAGLQYRPIPQIVLKGDYQNRRNGAATAVDQWNLALGWLF